MRQKKQVIGFMKKYPMVVPLDSEFKNKINSRQNYNLPFLVIWSYQLGMIFIRSLALFVVKVTIMGIIGGLVELGKISIADIFMIRMETILHYFVTPMRQTSFSLNAKLVLKIVLRSQF
jgi:hypothetical protein